MRHTAPPHRPVVLLGAEGCVELHREPWLLEVSDNESAWVRLANKHQGTVEEVRALATDSTGRPYFLVEVQHGAPAINRWTTTT